jgi:acylphosphatase
MKESIRHYNITVKGIVQGVFFRFNAHIEGLKLGVTGYVMNKPDGSVFIEAEGPEESINKLIEWCQIGPPKAKVTEVKAEEGEVKNYRNFEIRK